MSLLELMLLASLIYAVLGMFFWYYMYKDAKKSSEYYKAHDVMKQQEAIRFFCERVNDLACQNMLQPPYKLEGQHKRAMVILAREAGIHLSFRDEKVGLN